MYERCVSFRNDEVTAPLKDLVPVYRIDGEFAFRNDEVTAPLKVFPSPISWPLQGLSVTMKLRPH